MGLNFASVEFYQIRLSARCYLALVSLLLALVLSISFSCAFVLRSAHFWGPVANWGLPLAVSNFWEARDFSWTVRGLDFLLSLI